MPRPRRPIARLGAVVALLLGGAILLVAPGADPAAATDRAGIRVVQVQGLLDPPNASLIRSTIADANARDATLLVFQIDSDGALDVDVEALVDDIEASQVPIAVWVGPSGASASGFVTLLAEAAHVLSVSQGSGIGAADPARLDAPGAVAAEELADRLEALAEERGRDPEGARTLTHERLAALEALDAGAIDRVDPIVGELIVDLDGEVVVTAAGAVTLSTATVVGEGLDRRREPNQEVLFERLGLRDQLLHALINPSIAYLLLVAGLALVVFELFTASIGLAGATGAVSLIAAAAGFAQLPLRWWALALILVAMLGFAIDAQAGAGVGGWTVIGVVGLIAGSIFLVGGSPRLSPPWWVLLAVVVGTVLFMTSALAAMIRTRFSTPTIGREGLIGATGTAEREIAPEGVVLIDGSRWRARTHRVTPIAQGATARVVAVEGVVLEVEPTEGPPAGRRSRRRSV